MKVRSILKGFFGNERGVGSRLDVIPTWPIRTELANRPVARGTAALASSIGPGKPVVRDPPIAKAEPPAPWPTTP